MKDSHHSYSYDQNGNLLQVDAGETASYIYDALNQREQVKVAAATRNTLEITYDFLGRRITTWDANANTGIQGQAWLGSQPLAYRDVDGTTYFQQADWVGTQRLLTNYAGSNVSAYRSNAFGDGYSASSKDDNTQHYAGLERDAESGTDHAQFRQYNTDLGQWMSLDPYRGSYDFNNPQSYNRYTYAMNTPRAALDPSGLIRTPWGTFADPAFGGFFSNWDIFGLLGTAYTITLPGDIGTNPFTGNLSANSNLLYVNWWSIADSLTPGSVALNNGWSWDEKPHWPILPTTPRQSFINCFTVP